MRNFQRLGVVPAFLLLVCAVGCATSRWEYVRARPDQTATTHVTVRTDPTGAEVSINDTYLGESPVRVPVMYPVEIKVYERRNAIPYPHIDSKELKTYVRNVFTFTAVKAGYKQTTAEVTLLGAEEREITIKLKPRPQ